MNTMTATRPDTDLSPVSFDVEPLLYGPEHTRADSAAQADYWTVYARHEDGPGQAEADVADLADALAWVSLAHERPTRVNVNAGPAWVHLTIHPVDLPDAAAQAARDALTIDPAEHNEHADLCGCEDGPEDTPEPGTWVETTRTTSARYTGTDTTFALPSGVKLLIDHVFPTTHEVVASMTVESAERGAMFIPTADVRALTQDETEAAGLDTRH